MKRLAIVALLLISVSAVQAGTIIDIQTGGYAELDEVTVVDAIVTGTSYYGFFISEIPNGPYAGIWVFAGADWELTSPLVEGDLCTVTGIYKEYYDLSEIEASTWAKTGEGPIFPSYCLTIPELNADPEMWESCFICITSGMIVTTAPDSYGEWMVECHETPGEMLTFDDLWYDDTTVAVGDCYNWAGGVLNYSFGVFKLEAFAEDRGIGLTECSVATEEVTFGAIKTLFR